MTLKKFSLYYLIGYLGLGGIGFLSAPDVALRLLGSTGNYSEIMVRALGSFMIALSVLITQAMRHDLEPIVRTTVFVRCFFVSCFVSLFAASRDPMFLVITGIVTFGLMLTIASYLREGKNPFSVKGL
jgi:uncharacterized protein YjeT (DUF2065 family)